MELKLVAGVKKTESIERSIELSNAIREHYSDVFRFCSKIVGADAAEDITQDTFVTAHRRHRQFEGRSSVKTWLFSIALNLCRNSRRKKCAVPLEDWDYPEVRDPSDGLIDAHLLRSALGGLSEQHRDVVLLHETEGLTYLECATVLGIPEGTVKSRLYHAFKQLRSVLQPGEVDI